MNRPFGYSYRFPWIAVASTGVFPSVMLFLKLRRGIVGKLVVEPLIVRPPHPLRAGQLDLFDGAPATLFLHSSLLNKVNWDSAIAVITITFGPQ